MKWKKEKGVEVEVEERKAEVEMWWGRRREIMWRHKWRLGKDGERGWLWF